MLIWQRFAVLTIIGTVVAALPAAAIAQDEVVVVTVAGDGLTQDEAVRDAQRKALEQGAAVEISSHSQVENFELIRDSIYARADGIIEDFKILGCSEGVGGVVRCEIRASVSKSAVASSWGAVQNVLDQIGRPGIAIYILERIDGTLQDSSILESRLENRLLERGFKVLAGQQLRALMEKESADASAEGNVARIQAIAKDFGAQIFIEGTSQANAAGVKVLAGQQTAMYNADAMIKMFYTDTAQLIASEPLPTSRGGARGYYTHSPQAGKKAIDNAGEELVENLYYNAMRNWATQISYGGELELEIQGLKPVQVLLVKKKLMEIDNVERVNTDRTKDLTKFRIRAKMTAEDLTMYLIGEDWAELIDPNSLDWKTNRIQAKAPGT
jgi:hypothetical protein